VRVVQLFAGQSDQPCLLHGWWHKNGHRQGWSKKRKQYSIPGDNDIRQREEISCSACKYTGMLVCMSLSLYFAKLATDDTAGVVKQSTKITKNHKPFFCVCSAGWAVAGVYRWYLG